MLLERKRSATSVLHLQSITTYVYIVDERRLIFWQIMLTVDNIVLAVLSRAVASKFVAVYGIKTWTLSATKS